MYQLMIALSQEYEIIIAYPLAVIIYDRDYMMYYFSVFYLIQDKETVKVYPVTFSNTTFSCIVPFLCGVKLFHIFVIFVMIVGFTFKFFHAGT